MRRRSLRFLNSASSLDAIGCMLTSHCAANRVSSAQYAKPRADNYSRHHSLRLTPLETKGIFARLQVSETPGQQPRVAFRDRAVSGMHRSRTNGLEATSNYEVIFRTQHAAFHGGRWIHDRDGLLVFRTVPYRLRVEAGEPAARKSVSFSPCRRCAVWPNFWGAIGSSGGARRSASASGLRP